MTTDDAHGQTRGQVVHRLQNLGDDETTERHDDLELPAALMAWNQASTGISYDRRPAGNLSVTTSTGTLAFALDHSQAERLRCLLAADTHAITRPTPARD